MRCGKLAHPLKDLKRIHERALLLGWRLLLHARIIHTFDVYHKWEDFGLKPRKRASPHALKGGGLWRAVSVSVGKGPLVWANTTSQPGGPPFDGNTNAPVFISGTDAVIYITTWAGDLSPTAYTTMKCTDHGKTWAVASFPDGDRHLYPAAFSSDGHTIAAIYGDAPNVVAVSSDGGRTWRKAPTFPDRAELDIHTLLVAPDGTLFATSQRQERAQDPDNNVYTTRPGAAQWSIAAVLPLDNATSMLILVSDASGHPTALVRLHVQGGVWTFISHHL